MRLIIKFLHFMNNDDFDASKHLALKLKKICSTASKRASFSVKFYALCKSQTSYIVYHDDVLTEIRTKHSVI